MRADHLDYDEDPFKLLAFEAHCTRSKADWLPTVALKS
jgi:hypothetical protein